MAEVVTEEPSEEPTEGATAMAAVEAEEATGAVMVEVAKAATTEVTTGACRSHTSARPCLIGPPCRLRSQGEARLSSASALASTHSCHTTA